MADKIKLGDVIYVMIDNKIEEKKIYKINSIEVLSTDEKATKVDRVLVGVHEGVDYGFSEENCFLKVNDLLKKLEANIQKDKYEYITQNS